MQDFLLSTQNKVKKIIIACFSNGSKERIKQILQSYDIQCTDFINIQNFIQKNHIALTVLNIGNGFYIEDNFLIIGESALLGERKRGVKKKNNDCSRIIEESQSLNIGELVVHRYHGIGKFDGIHNITAGNVTNDFIKIIYYNNDVLFVPVEDVKLITRYGIDNPLIKLDRLGHYNWNNRKEKIKKKIQITAEKLLQIAADRKLKTAPILIAELSKYEEFKENFGFIETEDQLNAIQEIEKDLSSGIAMDRLICGDVGFGKTEIAMRSAFIASNDKKYQVAIITPTTLLCRQHYNNFKDRFKGTGLVIKQLSRMVSNTESKKIKNDLKNGNIDIIIGTHALLNKNISFKKLALLIVDEEQHFGVSQKEKLKEIKSALHFLSLSATPIPRTLQMSLSGVKELSIIATPPIDRLSVKNFVIPYDSVIIREAILREYNRGGKVFFVVPKIKDIEDIEDKLRLLVPEIKIKVAHGKMLPATLDKIMNEFYDNQFNMLLSTTIIESGIDISCANTIIIYKADYFGLSQLYQLRGRVGRGKLKSYAYFITQSNKKLTDKSKKKLEIMQTLDSLGSGFAVASHDMDIRGSGNILGDEQSGHIKETGVLLYQNLLKETIEELRNKNNQDDNNSKVVNKYPVSIKLGVSSSIPTNYIKDLSTRFNFYNKIDNIDNDNKKEQLIIELTDRFGNIPDELNNMLEIAYLKSLSFKCNIEVIEYKKDSIIISFKDNIFYEPDKLIDFISNNKNKILILGQKISFKINKENDQNRLQLCKNILNSLNNLLIC